ncbi:MAG: phosphatase [Cytophagales bacterium]|nr:MAG: phosphatase [Cytophagales bacterium]
MNLAAIDIGSNGARLLINRVLINENKEYEFKSVEYVRFPLRLGEDVFDTQYISPAKELQMQKLMQAFKLLMELHEVEDYLAFATSAIREAKNGAKIVEKIHQQVGIKIEIIDGVKEAEYTHYIIKSQLKEQENYLHIDVGGGSTELNLYANKEKIASKSFEVGSIRNTQDKNFQKTLDQLRKWIVKNILLHDAQPITAIGTGGNINKIFSMVAKKDAKQIHINDIESAKQHIAKYTYEERINLLKLNPDRADTILPAAEIYLTAMKVAGALQMLVPNVGLKDGMMEILWQKNAEKFFSTQSSNY